MWAHKAERRENQWLHGGNGQLAGELQRLLKDPAGLGMKRLQTDADSYLSKPLNIHIQIPAVAQKGKNKPP